MNREILISPGFGAGWSTWASDDIREFMLFDEGLIQLAKNGAGEHEVEEYIQERLGDVYVYTGGWSTIKVISIPKGTSFLIDEYDGPESLVSEITLPYIA